MLRTGLLVMLAGALVGCGSAATTAPSQAAPASSDAASVAPTVEPTPEATPAPTPEPRAATDFIVTAADVPTTYGAFAGLKLSGPNAPAEIAPESLSDWEEASDVAKILAEGFVSGYRANFNYGSTELYSGAYVFDNPEGALAYQADSVAGFVGGGCTDVSDTVATIGDSSSAVRCPAFGPVEPTVWIVFVTGNAVATVRIKAMAPESAPSLELLAEIAGNLESRVAR